MAGELSLNTGGNYGKKPLSTRQQAQRDREQAARKDEIVRKAQDQATKVDAITALTHHAMNNAMSIDDQRQKLHNGDEARNAILSEIEIQAVEMIKRELRRFDS